MGEDGACEGAPGSAVTGEVEVELAGRCWCEVVQLIQVVGQVPIVHDVPEVSSDRSSVIG